MFFKLAVSNVKKSVKDYAIYFLTLVFGVCVFYAFNSVGSQSTMMQLQGMEKEFVESLNMIISAVSVFIAILLGFLIVYANRFLIRRRTKEFGIYLTLGMKRSRVTWIIVLETLFIGAVSLAVGLMLGVLLSQGLSLVAAKMFGADLSRFDFVFSASAFVKTLVYFGIVFLVVMAFSAVSVARYRLINLLNASKKVEVLKSRSFLVSVPCFIVSLICIGLAYYTLRQNGLITDSKEFSVSAVLVTVGTVLFFFSLSGFFLRVMQSVKGFYLRNLNMFVMRQLSSKINTAFVSISVICIMLFLAISIFAGGMGMAGSQNEGLDDMLKLDMSVMNIGDPSFTADSNQLQNVKPEDYITSVPRIEDALKQKVPAYETYVAHSQQIDEFYNKDFTLKSIFPKGMYDPKTGDILIKPDNYKMAQNVGIVPLSQYNATLKLRGDGPIQLGAGEYACNVTAGRTAEAFKELMDKGTKVTIGDASLEPGSAGVIPYYVTPQLGDAGLSIIVPDEDIAKIEPSYVNWVLNIKYKEGVDAQALPDAVRKAYEGAEDRPYAMIETAANMKANSVGATILISYLAIYIGFILLITCAAVLAIQQLSEASDNVTRYTLLSKIGVDGSMISHALFMQVGIYFFMPVVLALAHSYVALGEVSRLAWEHVGVSISTSLLLMSALILVVYLVYFLVTFASARGIIRTKPAR